MALSVIGRKGEPVDARMPGVIRQSNWFVLVDPIWEPSTGRSAPPAGVIVGGWMLNDDGTTGPFRPNPGYLPSDDTVPTDPTDAVLRLIAEGEPLGDELLIRICDSVVEIGCDEDNQPLIGAAPDGTSCVVVATAEVQKTGLEVDRWQQIPGETLPDVVPPDTDILLNPNGRAPFRCIADALRHTAH